MKFSSGAHSVGIDASAPPTVLVNKHSLETAGLFSIGSFSQTVKRLFPHRLLMASGNVSNFTVHHRDQTVLDTNGVSLTADASSVELTISFKSNLSNGIYKYVFGLFFRTNTDFKVFLYGECGGTGYQTTTYYKHWSGSIARTDRQNNVSGGFFHRAYGTHVHISGKFRNFGNYLVNYGKSYAMNQIGAYNEFVVQKLTANSDQPVVLGTDMTWIFENVSAGSGVTLESGSYFYIEKVQTI